jgi:hypothetical protein
MEPSHILLMGWTGAHIRPLASYQKEYTKLFPHSRIVLVFTSPWDFCFRPSKRKQKDLIPLVEHLLYYEQTAPLRLFIHAFSEGGSNKATLLAESYHAHSGGCRLPVNALCLDSTPGRPNFERLRNALNKSLQPQPLLRHVGIIIGTLVIAGKFAYYTLSSNYDNNPISKTRRQLLNPTYFNPEAPRCYLYSESDLMVAWEDIKQHVRESTDKDIPVTEVMFEDTEHCKHVRGDGNRYWESVTQTWRKSRRIKVRSLDDDMFGKETGFSENITTLDKEFS